MRVTGVLAIGFLVFAILVASATACRPSAASPVPTSTGTPPQEIEIVSKPSWWEIACSLTASVMMVATVGIAAYPVCVARRSTREALKMARYSYLAVKWYDMKEKEFDHPDFVDSSKTQSYEAEFAEDKLTQYETFASMCWAYAEDAFLNGYHEDPAFRPTIRRCKSLHGSWFANNADKFSQQFVGYINALE